MSAGRPFVPKTPAFGAGAFLCATALLIPSVGRAGTLAVDAGTTYQTITGFGAASAWNTISAAQAPVLWADDSAASVADTAGHVDGHVGFSMLRTRIDPTEETAGTGVWAAETANMTTALGQNANIHVWSSEWTPPNADKENGAAYSTGNTNSFNGLPTTTNGVAGTAAADTDYSSYLVKYVNYVKTNIGINLYALSIQNEPDYNPTSYESALWTGQQFDTFVGSYVGPAFKTAGFSTKLIITESFSDNLALAATTMDDATAAPMVGVIAGHLYGDMTTSADGGTFINSEPITAGNYSHLTNQDYWETEMSDVSGAGFDATMTTGLQEAYWLHTCIVDWGMNAYHHWWINGTDNSSLYDTTTNTWSDKLYVIGNFSKFIRPGFVRIGATETPATGLLCSAYDTASRVVIVCINRGTGAVTNQAFSITGLTVDSVVPWVTDSANNLVQQAAVTVSGGAFTYTLPAQSVVTFVGDCVSAPSPTDTPTLTRTATFTPSDTPSSTGTPTATRTPTGSPSSTQTPTSSPSSSPTRTVSPTASASPTLTPTGTSSASTTASPTGSPTGTGSPSGTATVSVSPSRTESPVGSPTPSVSASPSGTATASVSPSGTESPVDTPTASFTASPASSPIPSFSASPSGTVTVSVSPSGTESPADTATPSFTASPVSSPTPSFSASPSGTVTVSVSPSGTESPADTATPSFTASPVSSPTPSFSASPSGTATVSVSPSGTESPVDTPTPSFTVSPSSSVTTSWTGTSTPTPAATGTPTFSDTMTASPSVTAMASFSATVSPTLTRSPTSSPTPQGPQILGLSPSTVPAGVTSTVTITGTGFLPDSQVLVGGVLAQVLSENPTGLTVIVPAEGPETVQITVQNPGSPPSNGLDFVYKPAATPTPAPGGPLQINQAVPVPNPDPKSILVNMAGPADSVTGTLYSVAFRLVRQVTWGSQPAGWDALSLAGDTDGLPLGLYYVVLQARRGEVVSQTAVVKIYLLR